MKDETKQQPATPDADAMAKLTKAPVSYTMELAGQPVECWLAPLTYQERIHVNASANEAYRVLVENGAEHKDALSAATIAIMTTTAFYSMRSGPHPGSPRLFKTTAEVTLVPFDQVGAAMERQATEFSLTEDELGNSLRARVTTSTTP
jgi:hypothetical protein